MWRMSECKGKGTQEASPVFSMGEHVSGDGRGITVVAIHAVNQARVILLRRDEKLGNMLVPGRNGYVCLLPLCQVCFSM